MHLKDLTDQIVSCNGNRWMLFDTEEQKMLVLIVNDREAIFVGLNDTGGCSSERTEIKEYIKNSYKLLRSIK